MSFVLFHRLPVANEGSKDLLLGDAREGAGGFGPLKVVLRAIPAVYANHEVRKQPPFQDSTLTNTFSAIHRCREKGSSPSLARSRIRRMFRFASRWRGGAEVPGWINPVRYDFSIIYSTDSLLASSRTSKENCRRRHG